MSSDDGVRQELISAIQALAQEMGYTPTLTEFELRTSFKRPTIRKHFESYTIFVQAAALPPVPRANQFTVKKPSINEVMTVNLENHLSKWWEKSQKKTFEVIIDRNFKTTASAGDIHFPFACMDTVRRFIEFVQMKQPKRVIQLGDLKDRFAHSRFARSLNVYTPKQEDDLADEMARWFWSEIHRVAPKADCYQIVGNHDVRPIAQVLTHCPSGEEAVLEAFKKEFTFEGVHTIFDPREPLILGNTLYTHGVMGKLGDHRDYFLTNVVTGHTHTGGIVWRQKFDPMTMKENLIYEANAGYMGDPFSKAMGYTPVKYTKWTKGWLWEDEWGPQFVRMK